MNYQNAETADRLASEFVLGTLRGAARRRFVHLLADTPTLQQAVRAWEERLMPLVHALPPVAPPASVWRSAQKRLSPTMRRSAWWDRIAFWRAVATASFAGLAVLSVVHHEAHDQLFPDAYVALLADARGTSSVLVSARQVGHVMTVKMLGTVTPSADESFHLWGVSTNGAYRALGEVQPNGVTFIHMHGEAGTLLLGLRELVVSVERAGPAPGNAPEGAILYRGPVLETT